jgi:hypothetical protein
MSSLVKNVLTPFMMITALVTAGMVGYMLVGIISIILKISGTT